MTEFEVGDKVYAWNTGTRIGEIYAARPGRYTGQMMYSVKFEVEGKNRSHGFYYAEEIERVQDA